MSDPSDRGSRSMFIVSNDYGELLLAMMFLEGQQLAKDAAVLLPERLYAANAASLGIPAYEYTSLADIVGLTEEWNPRIVALMSGYLFSNNKLLSRGNLRKLVQHLHATRRRVLTSDPFLGLATTLSPHDVSLGMPSSSPGLARRWSERKIAQDLARVSQILSDVDHLYPFPASGLSGDRAAGGSGEVQRVSFFNRVFVGDRSYPQAAPDGDAPDAAARTWLFVLASHDLRYQQMQCGVEAFAQQLADRLEEVAGTGCQPSVIGPTELLEQLTGRLSSPTSIELLDFCSYRDFMARLAEAEYVFYWNLFSASLLARISRRLPVFFFDRGHLSRLIGPMYRLGRRVHLRDWEPDYLTLDSPLDPVRMAEQARDQQRRFEEIVGYWEQSPSPDELIGALARQSMATR